MPQSKQQVSGLVPFVSVIVPARNEEACLERCLTSLADQHGVAYEIIVVDDGSTDRTAQIADTFSRIRECPVIVQNPDLVGISAIKARSPLPEGWTGKANALWSGVQQARGRWLLFTDADTVHKSGSLAAAIMEATEHGASLLSYSPEQEVHGFTERALMPVVFSDLATTYRPKRINDPNSNTAAANGQYLLLKREAYDEIGGIERVAGSLLEDVALARVIKATGRKLRFRFGGDAVSTRMYRNWETMREGWTKNLVLLFPNASSLAWRRVFEFAVMSLGPISAIVAYFLDAYSVAVVAATIATPT